MQRRAAAIYAVFFIVIGAASYSLIATATAPTIAFPNAQHRLAANDTFTVGNEEFTVDSVSAEMTEGGIESGGGGMVYSASFSWVNESARYTETWENNSTVTYDSEDWRVLVPNTSDPNEFTLRSQINKTAILQNDSNADNQTVKRNGQEYVVIQRGGNATLVPADEYFPAPETRQFSEGDSVDYKGNETTFTNVSASGVVAEWTAPKKHSAEVSNEANVTLGDQTYLAYFPNEKTVVLTQNYESYNQQQNEIATFHEREDGLWGVTITSGLTVVVLLGLAYMPSRY